jgi:hypothetical protein
MQEQLAGSAGIQTSALGFGGYAGGSFNIIQNHGMVLLGLLKRYFKYRKI